MVQETLEKTKKLIWPEIQKYLKDPVYPTQFRIPNKYKREVDLYWKINRVYPERKGKYLRPTLVLLIAEALGAEREKALKTAAAMQLSEEWILIHDDIEDNSEKRRGKLTLHKIYGNELAINAGDVLQIIMWKILNDQNSPKISEEFYKMLLRTTLGQGVEQIWTNRKSKRMSEGQYFFIADSKSAYYSIAGPMRLGAIAAGATSDQIDNITDFGLYLGRCFQLADDILDSKQDKKEGKLTLANTKGVPYARKMALEEKNKALEIFDKKLGFLSKESARSELKELIDFILERKY
ncbi:MAG: polyprenyl synthetase family protein [Candidatus Woesebacteria bacterium]|nr:polyprenyl synthetase family protein [Candidatus Woesebacteria bacterium]